MAPMVFNGAVADLVGTLARRVVISGEEAATVEARATTGGSGGLDSHMDRAKLVLAISIAAISLVSVVVITRLLVRWRTTRHLFLDDSGYLFADMGDWRELTNTM